jgi:crotonobetainyl-CoA:carnitine CoA-transferase CaiB-like acyl-CoA transferase
MLGEHTHEIATELLHLSDDEIATLVADQVLF